MAGLCSHVKENRSGTGIAKQMAIGDDAPVSELTFRRLLAINDHDELYRAMIRIVRLLDNAVNLCDLAGSVYWWNEITKKKWAYDYYGIAKSEK